MSETRMRQIAREEISTYDFGRRITDILLSSNYQLKKELTNHCDLKIENYVEKKLDSQRRDIFQTIRDIGRHDPIIMKNIDEIAQDFKSKFSQHCSEEIAAAKTSISAHLRAEVTNITSIPPYQHIANHIKEETKQEIQSVRTQSNFIIGSLALINVGLLAYIARK